MNGKLIMQKLSSGHPLIYEHDEEGNGKYLLAGRGIPPLQAQAIIRSLKLIPQADSLFSETKPQTWKLRP